MSAASEDVALLPYAEWGDPSSPLVVLLHGLLSDHRAWMPAVQLLANDYCVVAPDLPGHGTNQGDRDIVEPSVAALAHAVRALILERGATICAIAGEGLGAAVALELALDTPDLLAGLALVGLPFGPVAREQQIIARRFGTRVVGKREASGIEDPFLSAGIRARYARLDAEAFLRGARLLDSWGLREGAVGDLGATPLLIVVGEHDPSRQATEAFARHIAHARIAVLHEAADRPLDARPEAVAALLADFLHGVEDGAPLGGSIIA